MSNLPKVAIAGATGNLGPPILKALLDAGFSVTILTRESSTSNIIDYPNQTVRRVNYTSHTSLKTALEGVDVVVTTLALESGTAAAQPLVDAAIAAGVSRFLPAEFGSDVGMPANAALAVFRGKADMRKYIEDKVVQHPNFSYTYMVVGPFYDWCLENGVFGNVKNHSATLYNGGDVPFSTSRLTTVGQGVVGVVRHLDETKNKTVKIHDGVTTQNRIIAAVKSFDGQEWKTETRSTKDVERWANHELTQPHANIVAALYGLISVSIFGGGPEHDADYTGATWNEKFGIKLLSDEEMDQIVVDTAKAM